MIIRRRKCKEPYNAPKANENTGFVTVHNTKSPEGIDFAYAPIENGAPGLSNGRKIFSAWLISRGK